MKVWGSHTKGMDHLHRRAEEHIERGRAGKKSAASKMHKLSRAEQRKVLTEQRLHGTLLGPKNRRKSDR